MTDSVASKIQTSGNCWCTIDIGDGQGGNQSVIRLRRDSIIDCDGYSEGLRAASSNCTGIVSRASEHKLEVVRWIGGFILDESQSAISDSRGSVLHNKSSSDWIALCIGCSNPPSGIIVLLNSRIVENTCEDGSLVSYRIG